MTDKKTAKKIIAAYDKQIRKDMGFWIKYRPSRWGDLLPDKFISPFMKGKAVIETFIKGDGRAQRGNFLKS